MSTDRLGALLDEYAELERRLGQRVMDAAPGDEERPLGPPEPVGHRGQLGRIRSLPPEPVGARLEEVLTAPVIREQIGKRFQISGMDSIEEARDLALLLRAGALAAPIEIVEERTIGPSLGAGDREADRVAGASCLSRPHGRQGAV